MKLFDFLFAGAIDRLAEKYGGYVNRQSEEGAFATEVMLPLEE